MTASRTRNRPRIRLWSVTSMAVIGTFLIVLNIQLSRDIAEVQRYRRRALESVQHARGNVDAVRQAEEALNRMRDAQGRLRRDLHQAVLAIEQRFRSGELSLRDVDAVVPQVAWAAGLPTTREDGQVWWIFCPQEGHHLKIAAEGSECCRIEIPPNHVLRLAVTRRNSNAPAPPSDAPLASRRTAGDWLDVRWSTAGSTESVALPVQRLNRSPTDPPNADLVGRSYIGLPGTIERTRPIDPQPRSGSDRTWLVLGDRTMRTASAGAGEAPVGGRIFVAIATTGPVRRSGWYSRMTYDAWHAAEVAR